MQKKNEEKSILWVWGKIFSFLNAIALLNLFNDLFPTIIKWINFFKTMLSFMAQFRDFVLYPITTFFDWSFQIEIPEWLRSYIFVGAIMVRANNHAHKTVCGVPIIPSLFRSPLKTWPWIVILYLWGIATFPYYALELINFYHIKRTTDTPHVTQHFGLYLRDLGLIILFFVFFNYMASLAGAL